jgi:hypothetical protein
MSYKDLVLSVYPQAFVHRNGYGFINLNSSPDFDKFEILWWIDTTWKRLSDEEFEAELWKQAWLRIQEDLERKLSI